MDNDIGVFVEGSLTSPEVIFQKNDNLIIFKGYSLPEYGDLFYDNIQELLDAYVENISDEIRIEFDLVFLDTLSSKRIFLLLKRCLDKVKRVVVAWRFDSDDEDMKEIGEDYERMLGISFIFEPHKFENE